LRHIISSTHFLLLPSDIPQDDNFFKTLAFQQLFYLVTYLHTHLLTSSGEKYEADGDRIKHPITQAI